MAQTLQQAAAANKVQVAQVERVGEKLIIPSRMSITSAIENLMRVQKSEEEKIAVNTAFDVFPWDGAHALLLALMEKHGWLTQSPTPGFFGPNPPAMMTVETGPGTSTSVPWGRIILPQFAEGDSFLQTGTVTKNQRMMFTLTGVIRRKYQPIYDELCGLIRKQIATNSIYRGKAFKVRFRDDAGNRFVDADGDALPPETQFIKTDLSLRAQLILPRAVQAAVDTNLFTPIEHYAELKAAGLQFKRGVALSGKFGTGKTMISAVTAAECVKHGITFLLCPRAEEFSDAVQFAATYAPAVVFCEDIDRVTSGERNVDMDDILNTIDGIESKTGEVAVVLTTNEVEKINQAMIRPGRIDSVIDVMPPDAEAVERLVRMYAGDSLPAKAHLGRVGALLAGQVPAVIAEAVKRSKLTSIKLGQPQITAEALEESAETMAMQLRLLNQERRAKPSDLELAAVIVGNILATSLQKGGASIAKRLPELSSDVCVQLNGLPEVNEVTSSGLHGGNGKAR